MKLSDLLQNPLNRKIDREKVAKIKQAIEISGVIKPLVYTEIMTDKGKENMLTDGHHRYIALKEMGYKNVPAVMSDERGIRTAQLQDMKPIHKARKPCPEGYYRDKDGKCRRRANYGLIYSPHRRHKKPENGETPPSNGEMTPTETAKAAIENLRNIVKLVNKHGSHDQSSHSPSGESAQRVGQQTRSRLRSSGSFKQLRRELQSLASNPNKPGNQERMDEIQNELARESRSTRRTVREETKKHGSHDQKDHAPKGGAKKPSTAGRIIPYKGPDDAKSKTIELKNLVPAVADLKGNVHVGKRGQIHIDVIEGIKEFDETKFDRGFVDTTQGIYLTRTQAGGLASEALREQQRKPKRKVLKNLAVLRDILTKLNRLTKEGVSATNVSGLELTREDLQDEMTHAHPGHVKKHGQHDQRTHSPTGRAAIAQEKKPTNGTANVPNTSAVKIAQRYVDKAGLPEITSHEPVKVDKARARRIANAYDSMKDDPTNPEVKTAYKAMADEVAEQYKVLPVKIEYTKGDPYPNSEAMRQDVKENKRLKIFTGGEKHPLLGTKGKDGVTINDNFRAVHDYFGHAMQGYQFGPSGEENAWMEHSKMFSPAAQRAMTTETRGQNSWFNFSKENEGKEVKDKKFAKQKVGILPDEFLPKRARRKTRKGWTKPGSFRLSQKMDMGEGVNTRRPYKNPEGANVEGGRTTF